MFFNNMNVSLSGLLISGPQSVTVREGQSDGYFSCIISPDTILIQWLIDGKNAESPDFSMSGVSVTLESSSVSNLSVPASSEFNMTSIQCVAFNILYISELSEVAFLIVDPGLT